MMHLLLLHATAHQFGNAGSMMRAFNDRTMSVPLPSKLKGACPASAEHKNASVLSGATPLFSDVIDLPKDIADGLCCEMTQGNYYTNTLLGPSKSSEGKP